MGAINYTGLHSIDVLASRLARTSGNKVISTLDWQVWFYTVLMYVAKIINSKQCKQIIILFLVIFL